MTLSNISASFSVASRLAGVTPAQGGLETLITQTVSGEELDSFYSQVITGAALTTTDQVFDAFPAVELNGSPAIGEDTLPLLLNSTHAIVVQVIENAGQASAGFATVTIEDIGTDSPSIFQLVAGDAILISTTRGWPALVTSQLTVGATGLTNCNVVIGLMGKTDIEADGYGS